jgi:hypothetical protein
VQGLAVHRGDRVALVPLYRHDDPGEMRFLRELLDRLGGTSFRLDTCGRAIRRFTHVFRIHGAFLLRHGIPYLWRLAERAGTLRARYFCIVSHHFMSAAEIASPLGIERRSVCVFRVPFEGRLEPMCAVNASMRSRFYESLEGATPQRQAPK